MDRDKKSVPVSKTVKTCERASKPQTAVVVLRKTAERRFSQAIPEWLRACYRLRDKET